jgi:hypothetical protein
MTLVIFFGWAAKKIPKKHSSLVKHACCNWRMNLENLTTQDYTYLFDQKLA